jgi:hypothetical protein
MNHPPNQNSGGLSPIPGIYAYGIRPYFSYDQRRTQDLEVGGGGGIADLPNKSNVPLLISGMPIQCNVVSLTNLQKLLSWTNARKKLIFYTNLA